MSAYIQPPQFKDNVGQLVSQSDLEILRHNIDLAESTTWRWSDWFGNSGNIETAYTIGYYETDVNDIDLAWDGYLMIKPGMTTLTLEGRNVGVGTSIFYLYIDNVFKQQWTPGNTSWSINQTLSGYTAGTVVRVAVKVKNNGISFGGKVFFQDIYGWPLSFADTWPGTPTFSSSGASYPDAQLTQLSNATSWVLNRTSLVPRSPLLSMRYGLGSLGGPDKRIIMSGTVGRYYTNQGLRLSFQVAENQLPDLHAEVYVNGVLTYDSGTLPQGTTNIDTMVSLNAVTIGSRAEIEIWSNQKTAIARGPLWHRSIWTIWQCQAIPNSASIYTTPDLPPTAEAFMSQASLTAYLNALSAIVAAAKTRIDNQPNFYNRVRAQRRFYSKYDVLDELAMKRNIPRFVRCGDALIVNGKGVQFGYGGFSVPTTDRGVDYTAYTLAQTKEVIAADKLSTQVLWLDAIPGIDRGDGYYLTGQVRWAEETIL